MKTLSILFILFILCTIIIVMAYANTSDEQPIDIENFDDAQAVRAIVGECSGEGANGREKFEAMEYVAHAIRNRRTLKGVYGLYATHADHEPAWVWRMAKQAWEQSLNAPDPTFGADSWGNAKDINKPGWLDGKRFLVRYLNHSFYKTGS